MKTIFYVIIFASSLIASIRDDAEEYINSAYGKDVQVNFIKWLPTQERKIYFEKKARLRFMFDHIYVWEITRSDTMIGIAI